MSTGFAWLRLRVGRRVGSASRPHQAPHGIVELPVGHGTQQLEFVRRQDLLFFDVHQGAGAGATPQLDRSLVVW
jgi:hypothetical protein